MTFWMVAIRSRKSRAVASPFDNEARVFGGHFRPADAQALEPRLLDEGPT